MAKALVSGNYMLKSVSVSFLRLELLKYFFCLGWTDRHSHSLIYIGKDEVQWSRHAKPVLPWRWWDGASVGEAGEMVSDDFNMGQHKLSK